MGLERLADPGNGGGDWQIEGVNASTGGKLGG